MCVRGGVIFFFQVDYISGFLAQLIRISGLSHWPANRTPPTGTNSTLTHCSSLDLCKPRDSTLVVRSLAVVEAGQQIHTGDCVLPKVKEWWIWEKNIKMKFLASVSISFVISSFFHVTLSLF